MTNFFFKIRHCLCFKNGLPALGYGNGHDNNDDSVEFVYCKIHRGHRVNKNYSQMQRNMEKWKIREDGELKWY